MEGSGGNDDQEEVIEIDFDMISGAKAKRVKDLYINERFMKTGFNETKLSARDLKKIFLDLQQLEGNLETIHVELNTTQITGAMIGSAITKNLTEIDVKSGLVLMNQDDRTALGKVIYEHEFLGEIRLHNLLVKERIINRWNKNPAPPLDILVPAFVSITFLNVLEISCALEDQVAVRVTDGTLSAPPPPKPMLSLLGIKELFHTLTLERLELTRVGLTDDHFGVLVEQLSQRSSSSCLKTLIVNENAHTDIGLDMLASLLCKSDCKLEHLECYQSGSVVLGTSLLLFEQAVAENTTLKQLRIHLWGDDDIEGARPSKSRIPFYLELNRKGRKRLLNKTTTNNEWLDLLVDVKEDPSLLFYCLRNSRFWWTCISLPNERPPGFVMPAPKSTSVSPLASPQRTQGTRKSASRLKELKDRHGEVLEGIDLKIDDQDDESLGNAVILDDGEDSNILKELAEKNMPLELSLANEEEVMQSSVVSFGAESYINDLMHQKQKRPLEAREEVLEDALEELDYALENDKLPPGMSKELYFHRVVARLTKEKSKQLAKDEEKLDSLLEKVLLTEAAKEVAAMNATDDKAGDTSRNEDEKK